MGEQIWFQEQGETLHGISQFGIDNWDQLPLQENAVQKETGFSVVKINEVKEQQLVKFNFI